MKKGAERRCLIYGLRGMIKTAKEKEKTPAGYEDNYWKITVERKDAKSEKGEVKRWKSGKKN